jgi:hypothetical protein
VAVVSKQISIPTNAATLLFTQQCKDANMWQIFIYNFDGTIKLGLGDSAMTRTTAGHQIAALGEQAMILPYGESLYGITMSGSSAVSVGVFAVGQPS